jgi:hypothetical protein
MIALFFYLSLGFLQCFEPTEDKFIWGTYRPQLLYSFSEAKLNPLGMGLILESEENVNNIYKKCPFSEDSDAK